MQRCFELAQRGYEDVSPNPTVGAVLVYNNQIIGEGYHERYGQAHAEINCLNSVKADNQKHIPLSTMYVSLEPCSHYGKTPPCVDAIIQSDIKHVIIGVTDPNEKVAGHGIQRLRDNGIKVELLDHIDGAISAARPFLYAQSFGRPHVCLKWAQSQDGFLGRIGQRTKISNSKSDILVHQWRAASDAIIVGSKTALIDNPKLNTRLVEGRSPIRVLVDRGNIVPDDFHIFNDLTPSIIFSREPLPSTSINTFVRLPEDEALHLTFVLDYLHQQQLQRILVEGGAKLLKTFIDQDLWDECRIIKSTIRLEEGVKAPNLTGIKEDSEQIGTDFVDTLLNERHLNRLKNQLSQHLR